jgi:hypothetical protein
LHLSMEVGDSHGAVVNKSEENDFEKKGGSNPVVYQLVRVNRSWLYCPYVYKIHQDVS